jgi:hypothetical protein
MAPRPQYNFTVPPTNYQTSVLADDGTVQVLYHLSSTIVGSISNRTQSVAVV